MVKDIRAGSLGAERAAESCGALLKGGICGRCALSDGGGGSGEGRGRREEEVEELHVGIKCSGSGSTVNGLFVDYLQKNLLDSLSHPRYIMGAATLHILS